MVGALGAFFWVLSMVSVVALLILIFLPHTKWLNRATFGACLTLLGGALGMLLIATIRMVATGSFPEAAGFSLIFLAAVGYVASLIDIMAPRLDLSKLSRPSFILLVLGVVVLVIG